MQIDNASPTEPRELAVLFRAQIESTLQCGQVLQQLFTHITELDVYVPQIKRFEEQGDRLTAEAYQALEALPADEFLHLAEQLVNRLDDIVDGINNTARIVDVCMPRTADEVAHELVATLLAMIDRLKQELALYPASSLASARACREALKAWEEKADQLYHGWRKTQRRLRSLPLVDESNWTEILGILEQTTDAAYHTALLLERLTKYRERHQAAAAA